MSVKKKQIVNDPLTEAINQINIENPEMQDKSLMNDSNIVDIMTFCESPKYLNLPGSNFNLWMPQKIILKIFYMGTRGNENLKLTPEEWKWLYANENPEERDGVVYEKNIKDVIAKLQAKEKENFNFTELHLCVGRRGSKCRSEDDRIATTEGSITFRELCDRLSNKEKIGICTYDPKTLKRSVTYGVKAQDNGRVKCYELETKRGTKETSSWNHPYLVWRDKWTEPKFVQMNKLKKGDRVAVADNIELFGKGYIGVNKAALLGHLQGDGGTTHHVSYTTACPIMLNDFTKIIKAEFPDYKIKYKGSQYDYNVAKKSGMKAQNGSKQNEVKEWLKSINCFGKKSIHKEVPDCIYRGSKEEVIAFLSRLFGCDGWASTEKKVIEGHGGAISSSIGYASSSRKLIDGVRHLLLKFGIHCVISSNNTKLNGKIFNSWVLKIKRKECLEKFEKEINIFSKEDRVRKVVIAAQLRIDSNSEFNGVPRGIWSYINQIKKSRGLSNSDIIGEHGRGHNERLSKQYSPCVDKILHYGQTINDKFLTDMGQSDVKWDEVKSVILVGKKQTVDLEIEGTHIIGGDIVSHNTLTSSIISAYEAYKLLTVGGGDPYKFYGIPRGEDIHIINVALSQDQAGTLFSMIRQRMMDAPFFQGRIANATTTEIRLLTNWDIAKRKEGTALDVKGSIVILCGHSNPDTLRGKSAILILFDELAFYDESGKTPGSAFYNALEPSTKKFKKFGDARLVEISSPNSPVGIFYDISQASKRANHILSFQLPTWCINEDIPYESLTEERIRNPESFAIEYGAQWAKSGLFGNYFESGLIERCIRTDIESHRRPQPGFNYYLHVDPAQSGPRYVAVLVAKERYTTQTGKKRNRVRLANLWVWDPDPKFGLLYSEIDRQMIQICGLYHPMTVSYDQYNSIQSLQNLKSHGINCVQTAYNRNFKNKIYQNLKDMMAYYPQPELLLYDDTRLILEMKALKYRPTMRGISLVVDKHGDVKTDDLIDALAGATAMASENIRPGLPAPVTVRMRF
jgi:intein/homing endonuclease